MLGLKFYEKIRLFGTAIQDWQTSASGVTPGENPFLYREHMVGVEVKVYISTNIKSSTSSSTVL